jgi:PhoH-like ATPase
VVNESRPQARHETHPDGDALTRVVLDTSVLVSDPDAPALYSPAEVVLPLTVIEELDKLKSRSDEVGWLARSAIRALESLRVASGGSLDGASLPGGGTLKVEINGVQKHFLAEHGLDPERADNRILGTALGYAERSPVLLVSNDAALRIKAAHFGLEAREHHQATQDLGTGWAVHDTDATLVDTVYADRSLDQNVLEGNPNSFAVLRSGSASAMLRRTRTSWELLAKTPPEPWGLRPRSKEQRFALELLLDPDVPVVALHGPAGTGKSILAIAAGLHQVVEEGSYQRLSVFRSLTPVGREEVGFLPGDLDAKVLPYFAATFDSVTALTERRSARDAERVVEQLMANGQLTMEPVSFLRGRSLAGTFIVVDEATNLERAVLKTLLTRVGEGTKIVFTGDTSQIDNPYSSASNNALTGLVEAFADSPLFGHLRLTSCERSEVAALAAELL